MSNRARYVLHHKISQYFKSAEPDYKCALTSNLSLRYDESNRTFFMKLPIKTQSYNIEDSVSGLANDDDNFIQSINLLASENKSPHTVSFAISRDELLRNILENNVTKVEAPNYLHQEKNVIVEFSSPNIAKPFHMGHFRSTILGNYVSNLKTYLGDNVRRINYLGDWGTQLGLLHIGMSMLDSSDDIEKEPIRTLYNCYVKANASAATDPAVLERARKIFQDMEMGDTDWFDTWEKIKGHTTEELRKTYARIGVSFDEYHWESMYRANNIRDVISLMESRGVLDTDEDNRRVVRLDAEKSDKVVPVIKSDGSTLYITRDIAAALDRYQRYKFDLMYYVVDNTQSKHFQNLAQVLRRMDMFWAERLRHVRYGKIVGMSTRKGQVVFLKDFLDEMRNIFQKKQIESPNTKVAMDLTDNSADILGMSAVIINDFKNKRNCNYEFNWDKALDANRETGAKLQYTHARLMSLEENCGAPLVMRCEPSLLRESCVDELLLQIGKFEEILLLSKATLEPYILVSYLFKLSSSINKSFNVLRIKSEAADVGAQRLLLFRVARNVLAQGMRLLGITPLNKM